MMCRPGNPTTSDMTRLPLDVTVLEEIATDPLVGTHTSPELNDAGKQLKGFRIGRVRATVPVHCCGRRVR